MWLNSLEVFLTTRVRFAASPSILPTILDAEKGWAAAKAALLTYSQLLASPSFHRIVRRVHKKVHEMRSGERLYDPEDFTNLDSVDKPKLEMKKFLQYYKEELRDQFRGTTKK